MCGVAGILIRTGGPAEPVPLKRMTDALAHRGPDGEGLYIDGPAGLGHRRLAVIDLSAAARQPMVTKDQRLALSYNGAVYNFQELRAELEALGYQFRSRGDAELVLNAVAEWGLDAVGRFNGMFAFAIWNREDKELVLVRDRYGVKPIYYTEVDYTFLFASEIKALLAHGTVDVEIDRETLVEYLTFQNFFTDRTLFKNIRLLPAGCMLRISLSDDSEPRVVRYWDYTFAEPEERVERDAVIEELDQLFRQAVSRQLVSDVPVSAYLSGGMDTGAITAIAARQIPQMFSFTVGFDLTSASGLELGFDERQPAERMSYLFGTEHYEMVLKAGDMERAMGRLMWHLEEPRVGQSYPNYYAARLASRFGKVVLSGTGSDELFAGYPWRYYRAVINDDFEHYIDKYYSYWQRLIPNRLVAEFMLPIQADAAKVLTRNIFRDVFADHADTLTRPEDYINHSLYFEAKTFLNGLLVVEDKLSMAHGLETRVPFLDNDLVDFAMRMPVQYKLGNLAQVVHLNENEPGSKTSRYFERTRDGKLILRDAMKRHIPEDIVDGIKQGFSAPDASWFRGESIEYVRQTLLGRNARIFDFLDGNAVRNLVKEHVEGRENRRLLIWSLLCLEEWCRLFLEGAAGQLASTEIEPENARRIPV